MCILVIIIDKPIIRWQCIVSSIFFHVSLRFSIINSGTEYDSYNKNNEKEKNPPNVIRYGQILKEKQ